MRKTIEKQETKEVEKEVKQEFNLEEAFHMWKNTSRSGNIYLKGATNEELDPIQLVGYFNTNKKNPKEPDIRIFSLDSENKQDKEVCSLWENISKNEKRYLTGITDDKEKVIGFYSDENSKKPYIRVYYKQD